MRRSERPADGRENMVIYVLRKGLGHVLCAVTGFLLSGVEFIGELTPFGLGFAGGADMKYTLAASVGAAAGYLVFGDISSALSMISAAALVCFIKTGTSKLFRQGRLLYLYTGSVFASSFVCSVIVSAAEGLNVTVVVTDLCGAVIAAAAACFFYRVFSVLALGSGVRCISSADFSAFLFAGAVLLLSLTRFPSAGMTAAHGAAGFLIMAFALCGSEYAASMAGICFGVTLGLGGLRPHLLPAFALAGLLCGICGEYGRPAIAAAYVVSDMLALMLRGGDTLALSAAASVSAVILFIAVPEKKLCPAVALFIPARGDGGGEEQRRLMQYRLRSAAKAVRGVGSSVKAVADLLVKADMPAPTHIPEAVRTEVCGKCPKKDFCWEHASDYSAGAFREAYSRLLKNGGLTPETLPQRLSIVCREQKGLCESFNRLFCEYNARLTARRELFETKELAAMQFSSASAVLEDAAESLAAVERSDPRTAAAARDVLDDFGFEADPVIAYSDSRGRSTIEAFCSRIPRMADYAGLSECLYEKTGYSYLDPVTDEYSDLGTVLSFCEAAELSAKVHIASRTGAGETFCGDTCESFSDGRGSFYVVLSDGMGRGKRAALDSAMACSLTSRLMRAGFSMECAVNAVNSALMMKSAEETLSTLDILKIDLTDGKAGFYKAGAAVSVVSAGDKTAVIEKSSLPLGILKEAGLERAEMTLSAGDRIVIMSDGAAVLSPRYYRDLFMRMKNKGIEELAETAADEAIKYSPSGRHDDITVACVELE